MNENAVLESAAELSVIMVPAPNDPPKPSKEYQADLGVFTHGMVSSTVLAIIWLRTRAAGLSWESFSSLRKPLRLCSLV
jgi:hypothetical protein